MELKFSPSALTQLECIVGTLSNTSGFVLGREIGKIKIIEDLFPIHFDETNVDVLYPKIYSKMGDRLLGVFFNNSETFETPWFIEDVIIKIKFPQPEFFVYDAEKKYIPLQNIAV